MRNKGFSLLEVMITLLILSLISGIISYNLPMLTRISHHFVSQAVYKEDYLLFLMIFEDDFHSADLTDPQSTENMRSLIFKSDLNFDGDFNDAKEQMSYRWNSAKKRIDRKIGNGYFQSLLEGVEQFDWTEISAAPLCFKATFRSIFQTEGRSIQYCRD